MGGKQLVGFIHGVAVLNPVDQQCIPLYLGIQGGAAADTQRLLAVVGGQAHTEDQADHLVSGRDLAPIDNIVKIAVVKVCLVDDIALGHSAAFNGCLPKILGCQNDHILPVLFQVVVNGAVVVCQLIQQIVGVFCHTVLLNIRSPCR